MGNKEIIHRMTCQLQHGSKHWKQTKQQQQKKPHNSKKNIFKTQTAHIQSEPSFLELKTTPRCPIIVYLSKKLIPLCYPLVIFHTFLLWEMESNTTKVPSGVKGERSSRLDSLTIFIHLQGDATGYPHTPLSWGLPLNCHFRNNIAEIKNVNIKTSTNWQGKEAYHIY